VKWQFVALLCAVLPRIAREVEKKGAGGGRR
jgi:hypothetical protein